ncbi:MAG: AAA family ATPase [Thermoplasmata archaeon]|nr:AAA family ATPase [Thermoplasmata archaeon]
MGGRLDVFALCGMPGCGKGVVADFLKENGVPIHSMGDVVREHFRRECPGCSPGETGPFANRQRELFGKEIWARRIIEKIELDRREGNSIVMIDGLRSPFERSVFLKKWKEQFHVVAIFCPPDIRYKRLGGRGRGDDPSNRDEFDQRDSRELGWGLGDLIALSDHMIPNIGTAEDLCRAVETYIEGVAGAP